MIEVCKYFELRNDVGEWCTLHDKTCVECLDEKSEGYIENCLYKEVEMVGEVKQEETKETAITTTATLPMSVEQADKLAHACFVSKAFSGIASKEQALVKIMAGQELGIPPVQAVNKLYIVNGKIGMGVEAMATLLAERGYTWDMTWDDMDKPTVCEVIFNHNGRKPFKSRFTMSDAKRAGLLKGNGAWEKYPKDLLYARAFSSGARKYAPEALSGCGYTSEELHSISNEPIIEGEARVIDDNVPTPSPEVSPVGETGESSETEDSNDHWCEIHQTSFFRKGKMRWWAHPIGDTGKWCSENKKTETKEAEIPEASHLEADMEFKKAVAGFMSQLGWQNTELINHLEQNFTVNKLSELSEKQREVLLNQLADRVAVIPE